MIPFVDGHITIHFSNENDIYHVFIALDRLWCGSYIEEMEKELDYMGDKILKGRRWWIMVFNKLNNFSLVWLEVGVR